MRRGVVGLRRFQKALRACPDFRCTFFNGRRLRGWRRCGITDSGHVPGGAAADVLVDPLLNRRRAQAAGFHGLAAGDLHPRAGGVVIDVGGKVFHIELRPGQIRIRRLTELVPTSGAGEFDGFDVVGARGLGRRLQALRLQRTASCPSQCDCQANSGVYRSMHEIPLGFVDGGKVNMKNQPSAMQETYQPVFDQANEAIEDLALLPTLATTGRPVLQGSGIPNLVVLNIQQDLLQHCT